MRFLAPVHFSVSLHSTVPKSSNSVISPNTIFFLVPKYALAARTLYATKRQSRIKKNHKLSSLVFQTLPDAKWTNVKNHFHISDLNTYLIHIYHLPLLVIRFAQWTSLNTKDAKNNSGKDEIFLYKF